MKIKRDGIYKTIDNKDFGVYQKSGWQKVVVEEPQKEPIKPKSEPIVEELKIEEPVIEEVIEPDQPFQEEEPIVTPKPKKKKKV